MNSHNTCKRNTVWSLDFIPWGGRSPHSFICAVQRQNQRVTVSEFRIQSQLVSIRLEEGELQ